MSITVQQLNDRLSIYLRMHLPDQALKALTNDDYIQYYNDVARDLNSIADILIERFYKQCNTTNAEDDDLTNYLVQGNILKIFKFKFIDSSWETQSYTYVDDRIVLKVAPDADIQLDIEYLRDIEEVEELSDPIDLPDAVIPDFEEILKKKLRNDYSSDVFNYEQLLERFALKSQKKVNNDLRKGVNAFWMGQADDYHYDILDHWIGEENFSVGEDGNYTHVGGND